MGYNIGDIRKELDEYIKNHSVINTHSHHLPDKEYKEFTLKKLLKQTYIDWSSVTFDKSEMGRKNYLDKVRYKSYFVWLQKSLRELYGAEDLTEKNWEIISNKIKDKYSDSSYHIKILQNKCKYRNIILDTYWQPGSNNKRPDVFSPTFRIDTFLYGYSKEARDHDGNNPHILYGNLPDNISDYVNWVRDIIIQKKKEGAIALKTALAYDRELYFENTTKEKANRVFSLGDKREKEDILNFQNYLFWRICEIASEVSLPFQCHTGMGQLTNTRALELKNVIEKNPDTKFVLFHCSYPWMSDISGLLHTYQNVYPDLCWLPILSMTATERMLHELIEIGTADKVCWGCDTWTSEESFGALKAFQLVLAKVLETKIKDGYLTIIDAKKIVDNIMEENAAKLYGFKL